MPSLIANTWLSEQEYLGLMLDYDGTLTPIVEDPSKAFILSDRIEILRSLSRQHNIRLAIVSGRSIEQLRFFLEPLSREDILFCGLHGGEIYLPRTSTFLQVSENQTFKKLLEQFKADLLTVLERECLCQEGIFVEDKQYSIALHYRRAKAAIKQAAMAIFNQQFYASENLSEHFKIQPGKEVLEVLPKTFDKGNCVQFLYKYWGKAHSIKPCYVGDDLTDEAAFVAVNQLNGISLCINKPPDETMAFLTLSSVEALYDELGCLGSKS